MDTATSSNFPWIPRTVEPHLVKAAREFPILVVTGPRQVGKTSLLERLFPDYSYVSLDSAQEAETAETMPDHFLRNHPPPVVIDEVQYAPSLFRAMKVWVDTHRGKSGQFILTGSQSFTLMAALSESLAGRAAIFTLLSLSFEEWEHRPRSRVASAPIEASAPERRTAGREVTVADATIQHVRRQEENGTEANGVIDPWEFLWRGGFPFLWNERVSPNRDRWYQGYLATYLERDVRNLLRVLNLRDYERFLRSAAIRIGNLINLSETGRDVGISPTTARQWFNILHASGVFFLLEPYHRSLGKRITKSPKLYLMDTGLAAYLLGFSSSKALRASPLSGAFWENHVIGQWIRKKEWEDPSLGLWFWQDRTKNEVDLVIEKDGRLYPVECKAKEKPDDRDLKGIRKFREFYGAESVGTGYVACLTRSPYWIEPGVLAVNGWKPWPVPNE